jgi:translocation and assembly module TamB
VTAGKETPAPPAGETADNLALNLTVLLHRNTWIRHPNAAVELTGEVQVTKNAGGSPILVGSIETIRGWAGFQGRRFVLSRGQVVFTGEQEINPALDIVAQYRLPKYLVEAVVGGTLNEPSLTLRSEPELEQADIIAVLLFGRPASALDQGEQVTLQQQAIAITSGYAATKIGESVSQFLGLNSLGIDLQQIDFSGGRVGFGQYLTRKTYVSASQDLAGKEGQKMSVEYQLAPDWEITTSTSSSGSSGADIFWQKQY